MCTPSIDQRGGMKEAFLSASETEGGGVTKRGDLALFGSLLKKAEIPLPDGYEW